jgi:hypothetical protein
LAVNVMVWLVSLRVAVPLRRPFALTALLNQIVLPAAIAVLLNGALTAVIFVVLRSGRLAPKFQELACELWIVRRASSR